MPELTTEYFSAIDDIATAARRIIHARGKELSAKMQWLADGNKPSDFKPNPRIREWIERHDRKLREAFARIPA